MIKLRTLILGLILAFVACLGTTAQAASYTMTIIDLGVIGDDTSSYATSINNSGVVVGTSVDADGSTTAFTWGQWWPNNGSMLSLKDGNKNTYATAIDSSGRILGGSTSDNGDYRVGTWTSYNVNSNLNQLSTGKTTATAAYSINDNGQILASDGDPTQTMVYSIWGGHNPVKVGGDMEIKYASDINDSGQVIGETELGTPYIWNMYNDSTELISSIKGSATDINDSGEVVGTKTADVTESGEVIDSGEEQAYLYKDGEVIELGYVGVGTSSEAYAINEEGVIVGTSNGNAFVWSADSGMLNLNDLLPDGSEWTNLSVASDINDLGQIVGWGTINGETHAFLISEIVAAPEPKIIFIVLLIVCVALFRVFQETGGKA